MKLFDDTDMATASVKGFSFSAVRPETLGATEYTLVSLVLDKSGSVAPYANELFAIRNAVVAACRKSPRADYLLLRVIEFNSKVDETHGFKPLSDIDPANYAVPACHGTTALYDATYAAASASNAYAKTLAEQDYLVNAIVIVATDGEDVSSRLSPSDVSTELTKAKQNEYLESLRTVLVGVNATRFKASLEHFKNEATIDQYVDVADATPQRLAKLADFVSRSISAQSQSLGTGGPSQSLTF